VPNPEFKLKIGMIASLVVQPKSARQPAISVPLSAVVRSNKDANSYAVFVIEQQDGKFLAKQRRVTLGESFGNMIAVTGGLSVGDRVVTTGSARIADGELVNISP
jgi:multidrug efflux pump subunit AcrA (membrane-fusion protein)